MYSYLLNLTIEASRLIAKLETMVVTFSIRATTKFSHVPSNGTELVRFYDANFLWQFSTPPPHITRPSPGIGSAGLHKAESCLYFASSPVQR